MKNTYMRDIKQENECVNECVYVYPKAKNPSVISTDLSMFSNLAIYVCCQSRTFLNLIENQSKNEISFGKSK